QRGGLAEDRETRQRRQRLLDPIPLPPPGRLGRAARQSPRWRSRKRIGWIGAPFPVAQDVDGIATHPQFFPGVISRWEGRPDTAQEPSAQRLSAERVCQRCPNTMTTATDNPGVVARPPFIYLATLLVVLVLRWFW